MAYSALVSLAEDLDLILNRNFCNFPYEKQQIQSLHEKILYLLTYLEDFPREAAIFEARIAAAANQVHIMKNVRNQERLCKDVEKSTEEIDCIVKEVMQIKSSGRSKSPMSMPNGKEIVVGIEEDLMQIKDRLCGEPSYLQIIPIIGMGGIGKTTLARYAYHHPLIVDRFDIRVWVTVSRNSESSKILSVVLNSIRGSYDMETFLRDEVLVQTVYRYLKGRRYLIVMDDIWDTNVWDDVRRTFPDDCNGSRVIVTTRDLGVASYVDSTSRPLEMRLMSEEHSWKLLKEKVFGQENCPCHLEKIGKVIAERCRGLPLAIVVIAGLLSEVNDVQDAWEKIATNVVEAVNSDDNFSYILSLSYAHLPHHLRPCFLYMGGFPEDYEISVSRLIKLWAAEGFLESSESKGVEDLGYEYLEDLAKRNLVLTNKRRYNDEIKAVKIHDLLRDQCIKKARDERFLHVINEFPGNFPEGIENSHRLSVLSYVSGFLPNSEDSSIHTILLFKHWAFDYWKHFRLLKVVNAMVVTFRSSEAIRYIGELFHLRYLAFECEPTKPELTLVAKSLYQLQNLQTLIIRVFSSVRRASIESLYISYLELEIWRIPKLRHIILLDGFLPDPSTESCLDIPSLENLQTLTHIQDFTCSKRILKMVPNLNKLGIVYSYKGLYESGWSKYDLNNLVHLCKLEKLSLSAQPFPNLKNDVSQNISFPMALKKLTLSGCKFPWKDMTFVGSLPNLEVLKLKRYACHGTDWETNEGEFCQLKVLLIDSTDLHHWTADSSHFPILERLILCECDNLTEIPYSIGEIPTLESIEVDIRNTSIVASAKCIQEEQQSFGNDLNIRLLKSRSWRS